MILAMSFTLNGQPVMLDNAHSTTPLFSIPRNHIPLNRPKYGYGIGEQGALTVAIRRVAARFGGWAHGAIGAWLTALRTAFPRQVTWQNVAGSHPQGTPQ